MRKLISWFYPKFINTDDFETERRGRIIVGFALALTAIIPGYTILYYLLGNTGAVIVELLAMVVSFACLLYARRFGFSGLTVHFGLLIMLSVFLGIAYFSGGNRSPVLVWVIVIPYVAVNVLPRKSTMVWTILSLVLLIAMYFSWFMGVTFGPDIEQNKIIIMGASASVGILLSFFVLGLMAISAERRANKIIEMQSSKSQIIREAIDKSGDAIILFDSEGINYYQNRVLRNFFEIDESEKLDRCRFAELFVDQAKVKETLKLITDVLEIESQPSPLWGFMWKKILRLSRMFLFKKPNCYTYW